MRHEEVQVPRGRETLSGCRTHRGHSDPILDRLPRLHSCATRIEHLCSVAVVRASCILGAMKRYLLVNGLVGALALGAVPHAMPVARAETPSPSDRADPVLALLGQAAEHYRAGRLDQARELSVQAVALSERALGASHPVTALALNNLGATDLARNDPTSAAKSFARALPIIEGVEGPDGDTAIQVAEFLALALQMTRDFTAARPLWERVAARRERHEGAGLPLANDLVALGETCLGLTDFSAARTHFTRALTLREAALQKDHPEVIKTVHLLANTHRLAGDPRSAKPLYQRMLTAYEPVLGPDHPITLEVLSTLGLVEVELGELAIARGRFEAILVARKRLLGEHHEDTAQSYNNLGLVLQHLGDLDRALDAYERALAIRRKSQTPALAKNLANLGALRFARGDLRQARGHLEEALALLERVPGDARNREHALTLAGVMNNLGVVAQALGDRVVARAHLERSLSLRRELLGPEHPQTAQGLANLGAFLQNGGDMKGARPFFERALALYEKVLGKDHPDTATALDNLASVLLELGESDLATRHHQAALTIRERVLGKDHPDTGLSYNNLAFAKQRQGELGEAKRLLERALSVADKRLGSLHPDTARTLNNLGLVAMALGDTRTSLAHLGRAADIEERLFGNALLGGTERQKASFALTVESTTHAWVSLGLGTKDPRALELAFETVVRRKGRVLEAAADQLGLLMQKLEPDDRALLDSLAETRRRLATLTLNPPTGLPIDAVLALVDESARDGDRLESELAKKSEAFARARRPVELRDLKKARRPGTAIVELFVHHPYDPKRVGFGAPRYAAFLLSDRGLMAADLGPVDAVDRMAGELRREIAARRSATRVRAMASLTKVKRLAASLYELVLGPLQAHLDGARDLVIAADGELTQVPFEALVGPDGKWLVERFGVSYLTSSRFLLDENRPRSRGAPVIVGGVDYGAARVEAMAEATQAQPVAARSLAELSWKYLPGTLDEVRGLGALPLLSGATRLEGAAATEASLRALRGSRIVHIATHGFFLPDPPTPDPELTLRTGPFTRSPFESPLLRSGLALAGANAGHAGGESDDGILTALEASALDLQGTELVVLSACETGVGDVARGDGVVGLARALVLAGSKTQVMSLWQVDDEATRVLMVDFYDRLARGEGRAEAMRQARLAMLRGEHDGAGGPFDHPFYWAAFLLHGETGPISRAP